MINQEDVLETGAALQTEADQFPGQEFRSEESMLRREGESPPQTDPGAASSDVKAPDPGSLRRSDAGSPSQSGTAAGTRKKAPKSVVTIDEQPSVETVAEKAKSDLLDLIESMKSRRVLTGIIQGIEELGDNPNNAVAVIYHGDYKIVIPMEEAVELPAGFSGSNGDEIRHMMLSKRLGAEVDYIVKGLDQEANVAVASRLEAMRAKRKAYYFKTGLDGNYLIREGVSAEARVVSVIRAGIFVDLFGVETFITVRELSYQRLLDASSQFRTGQRVLVRILTVDRSNRNHIKVSASVKQAGVNPLERALRMYTVGNKYVGTVTMVDASGVFVALDGGVDCLCTHPKRGRPPRGAQATVRILGIDHEASRIWGSITHIAIAK